MQLLSNTCWLTELGCQEFIEHEKEGMFFSAGDHILFSLCFWGDLYTEDV